MTIAEKYALEKYAAYPTYQQIAIDAFNAGFNENSQGYIERLKRENKELKAELKSLWDTLEDPEQCGELLAGM